jgi:hypothetical protein
VPSDLKGPMTAQPEYNAGPFQVQTDKTTFVVK